MPFAGVNKFHKSVRKKIKKGEPGWAQSDIQGTIASYNRKIGWTGTGLALSPTNPFLHDQMEEMLVDVARDEGIASPETFNRDFVVRLIEGLRLYPRWNRKPHKKAELLENFYLKGDGAELLYN